jgi:hypothetical protein
MVRLRSQIENNTIEYTVLPSRPATLGGDATTRWDIEVRNVALRSAVLSLTWTSTILMLIETIVWGLVWGHSGKDSKTTKMKEEKYAQG